MWLDDDDDDDDDDGKLSPSYPIQQNSRDTWRLRLEQSKNSTWNISIKKTVQGNNAKTKTPLKSSVKLIYLFNTWHLTSL